jgi:hypothetical protein
VEAIETMIHKLLQRKTAVADALGVGKAALTRIRKHCIKHHLVVRHVLQKFDTDGSDDIDQSEMLTGLENMGFEHPPFTEADVDGVFQLLKVLGKLEKDGNVSSRVFADCISVPDAQGLYHAIRKHKVPTKTDIQKLGLTPPAFHHSGVRKCHTRPLCEASETYLYGTSGMVTAA